MYFTSRFSLVPLRIAVLVCLSLAIAPINNAAARTNSADLQICEATADYFLGLEDYASAVRHHEALLKSDPNNALAHYHLGFAYGMTNRPDSELREYLRAIDLGLTSWDLFLNLGLVYLENEDIEGALGALHLATVFGPTRPETHFNLALAYEQAGMLAKAEHETLVSIRLDSRQPDAWNTLAILYAEQGNRSQASKLWCDLVRAFPDYVPAQSNLRLIDRLDEPKQIDRSVTSPPATSASGTVSESLARSTLAEPKESGLIDRCRLPFVGDPQYPAAIGVTNVFAQPDSLR